MPVEHAEVPVEQLRNYCDPDQLPFESTEEIAALDGTVGQERGIAAIKFGFDIKTSGFNLYVAGPTGTGRNSTVSAFLQEYAKEQPVPDDLCYVNNFRDPDAPKSVILPPGQGCGLVKDMDELVNAAKTEIPRAFESENYEKRKSELVNAMKQERGQMLEALQKQAEDMGLAIEMTPVGIVTVPVMHGHPLSREEYDKLPDDQKHDLERKSELLQDIIQQSLARARKSEKDMSERMHELDQEIALFAIGHLLDDLRAKYKDDADVLEYLDDVQKDMMEHLDDFKEKERPKMPIPGLEDLRQEPSFDRYKVNLVVDNEDQKGAPVVVENNPSYYNLIGRVDFRAKLGALVTDFSMIKAGALHKANGGYLVVRALDILMNPMSWDALKRTLRSAEIRIENIAEHYGLIPTSTLKPEPVPLNVKVIMIGSATVYHLLYAFDEDFRKLFKVKADFDIEMNRSDEHIGGYASFIAARVGKCGLKHFDRTGVAKVVEYGSRLIEGKDKLSTRLIEISDIVSEASYWSSKNGGKYVTGDDVARAIEAKVYRSNMMEQKIQELIEKGVIMIDVDGEKVGQANGLSVYQIGDFMFGRPSRITAKTFIGRGGVTNIERETKMSGPIHDKGVMILSGYIAGTYAQDKPLPLGATLVFEQLYEGVEGDSASSTELYALLSSLADLPIKQNIAVTGSVNQNGEIQPIGGANYKIEGFYEVCKAKGITGGQGVIIPHQNVQHLMLKEEVVDAVKSGKFHIWPIKMIDEGIEILTGVPSGQRDAQGDYPPDSVHGRAAKKLDQFAETLKEFAAPEQGEGHEEATEIRAAAMRSAGLHYRQRARKP